MNGTSDDSFSALNEFERHYAPAHQPLVIIICLLGTPCHIACIATLSGRRLFSATNATLISLSATQLALICAYFATTTYRLLTDNVDEIGALNVS